MQGDKYSTFLIWIIERICEQMGESKRLYELAYSGSNHGSQLGSFQCGYHEDMEQVQGKDPAFVHNYFYI